MLGGDRVAAKPLVTSDDSIFNMTKCPKAKATLRGGSCRTAKNQNLPQLGDLILCIDSVSRPGSPTPYWGLWALSCYRIERRRNSRSPCMVSKVAAVTLRCLICLPWQWSFEILSADHCAEPSFRSKSIPCPWSHIQQSSNLGPSANRQWETE